ncbi:MAG TPA: ATP-binding cassette domain-containing protein [Candidatus Sulfotelmatobacter sp.]|nr:ATP-binding cassette domain-containing protein [Candidatus Sulfotelmatobacter sp.]
MSGYSYGKTLLKVEDVSLEYDGRPILKHVNAEVRDILRPGQIQGQVVGFLGPSGIGKTQLFRIIAGLNKPTSGRVSINGSDRAVQAGEVGVVAQNYPLFEHRTVMSNLLLAAAQKEKDDKSCRDKVVQYLTDFDLIDKAKLYPAQLSGGQRQRCAIIQQILCSEHFLLMDEPFSGLDLLMLEKTSELIQKVANMDDLNTIIVVTHDITAAAAVADHLWLMGRDHDASGRPLPGSHIVETYDLIERDLCWHPQIITEPKFVDFVREVKNRFRTL